MEGRVDRYASSRSEENHRRGSSLSHQLETGQREPTSLDKEMEGRVDRYASGRDTQARDGIHNGKDSLSMYDWKRRDRSSGPQWSPPFTSSGSSVQEGSGRFHSGFDSPQPSTFASASSTPGMESVHEETTRMSPPKRPRLGWAETTDSGYDDASHSSQPKRPRLGWGQGLAKYERKKSTDVEDCSKSAGPAKEENAKNTSSRLEDESVEQPSKPGSLASPVSAARTVVPEGGPEKIATLGETDVQKSDNSSMNPDLSAEHRPCSFVQGVSNSTLEGAAATPEALGPCGDSLPSQAPDRDADNSQSRVQGPSKECQKDSTQEHGLEESLGIRSGSSLVGVRGDLSGWSKEAITQQLMMVEAEVEAVEKELAKLAREDEGDAVDELTPDKSVQTGAGDADEQHGEEKTGIAEESGSPDVKVSDVQEVEVTPVANLREVAEKESPEVVDEVAKPKATPSLVEESSLSPSVQEERTEGSDPSKSDSECQTQQDSDEHMLITHISEQCDSIVCGHSGHDCGLCKASDEEDALPGADTEMCGLSDLMFYRYVLSVWSIIMENRRLARKASAPFQHLLPSDDKCLDFKVNGSIEHTAVWIKNEESHLKIREKMQEKLSDRKKLLKFKERVLALKYRALKEEQYHGNQIQPSGVFQRRDRVKPVRRWEVERRNAAAFALTSLRSTLRLRPVMGGPTRICNGEDAQLRRKPLAITPVVQLREDLKMPAMILDEKERDARRFVTTNGLVEDPVALEQERKSINPWTEEEKAMFMEKFALFHKNFSKIASYLPHKTTADCVEFYYRNQKSEEFEKIKRRRQQLKKRRDYALPASRECVKAPRSSHKGEKARAAITYDSGKFDQFMAIRPISTELKEIKVVSAADAAAVGVSPCSLSITSPSSSKSFREKAFGVKVGSAFIPPLSKVASIDEPADKKGMMKTSPAVVHDVDIVVESEDVDLHWTDVERDHFLEAVSNYGRDFKKISEQVASKTPAQCRAYFSKIRKRSRLDELVEHASESVPVTPSGGYHSKIIEFPVDVKITEVDEYSVDKAKTTELVPIGIQQDLTGLEGMCKVEVVERKELESGLSLLGKAVEDQQLIDPPAGKSGDTDAKEVCEEDSAGKSEDVTESAMDVQLTDEVKQPEQVVKVEPVTVVVTAENPVRIQKDVVDTCAVKGEGERSEVQAAVEKEEQARKEVKLLPASTSLVDTSSSSKTQGEDSVPGKVVVKPEPFISAESVIGQGVIGVPLVTTHHIPPAPVTCQPAPQAAPVRERGARVNAAGEFKPRREPTSWTQEEKEKFAEIIRKHGKDWALLDESLPGKSMTQIKTYFQNSKAKLGFLSGDGLASSGTRSCNRKRKTEESDTSSNAGSAGQIGPSKVPITGEDVLQKVVASSMLPMSTNMGVAPGVGPEGIGFSHFNPGGCQSVEDSTARDLQKIIRRICAGGDYAAQSNLVGGLMPLFQPGVNPSYPGPTPQQSLLLAAAHKQQLIVGHPTAQQPLQQVGLQQQQQAALTPHKQQQLITQVVQQLAVQQLQQQQQQTNQLVSQQPQQMVHQLQQLVLQQQQQQQHLAQVAKHIPPQLLHQPSHQHIGLDPNVHQQQMVSRAKLAAGVQQQVSHVTRLHPSHTQQQQQLFQQQKQILQQQQKHQFLLQQIQASQQLHDLQLHQQLQAHKQQQQQQQIPQHVLSQQQVQHGQPLSLFRAPYQNALAEAELLRHSEAIEQRNTPSNLGLLAREDLQPQPQQQRSQQVLTQQQQPSRAPPSSESQRSRMGDVKLFGQSLLSQPLQSSAPSPVSASQKPGSQSWQPVSPAPAVSLTMPANCVYKSFVNEPSGLAASAFSRPGGTALVGEGSQSWPVASASNLDLWSMMGNLQAGVNLYKHEDVPKSEVCSAQEIVTKVTARLSREGHEMDGDDPHPAAMGLTTKDQQRSTDGIGEVVRMKSADGSEVSGDGHLRVENEWRSLPRPTPVSTANQQAGYGQVVLDPVYTYAGERQSGSSQADIQQTWEGMVLERESSRNAAEGGSGKVVTPALASEMIGQHQQLNSRAEVYAPLSLPMTAAANLTKLTSGPVQWGMSGSLPHPIEPIGGTSYQPQGLMLRGLPDGEQTSTRTSETKSKVVDNNGGPL
ncbi:hypothetical protein R1sor_018851 [Riccia sorocarpa]|uniref:Nuclear receptor corepressor 1 n=1 Tax=Riccia sorocarpa TaxID=122646 RepID=A0ABD3IE74_9MARC